jgi:hypothetical protein
MWWQWGSTIFLKTNQHVFNESLYVSRGKHYVVQQVVARIVVKGRFFFNNFVFIFICIFKVGL